MTAPYAVIFDIDGTIADCNHRRYLVEGVDKDWKRFRSLAGDDTQSPMVCRLFRSFRDSALYTIILVTGRYEEDRRLTESWLAWHGLTQYADLHMRADGDSRPDYEVKLGIYKYLIEPHYDVKLVVDDRTSVVNMWRSLGLVCWQVAEGNF